MEDPRRIAAPPWQLPLLVAVLLLVATHLALWLSIVAGHVPACVPYWEGCTSISRAARHGAGNSLFKLLVIPCALLQAWSWWKAAAWLRGPGDGGAVRSLRWMRVLGVSSAVALAVYALFLGSEGEVYRFLRRYGITVYFGFGFVAQLLLLRRGRHLQRLPRSVAVAMAVLCLMMLGLGIGNVIAGAAVVEDGLRDRIENALEWQLGLLWVGWFLLLALAWRREGAAKPPGERPREFPGA